MRVFSLEKFPTVQYVLWRLCAYGERVHIVYPCHLISSQICEEFDQKKPEGQDKPQRLGEGVNVYSR